MQYSTLKPVLLFAEICLPCHCQPIVTSKEQGIMAKPLDKRCRMLASDKLQASQDAMLAKTVIEKE
jgi:hypothetical protein